MKFIITWILLTLRLSLPQRFQSFFSDRQLPDKAIDLIDEAASSIRMEIDSKPGTAWSPWTSIIQLKLGQQALQKEEEDGSKSQNV